MNLPRVLLLTDRSQLPAGRDLVGTVIDPDVHRALESALNREKIFLPGCTP